MKRDEILDMAAKITKGERETQYGGPEDNFRKIAELWSAYLSKEEAVVLTAEDVAVMMILFKVGRLTTGGGSADTWVDIAGYAACGGEIATKV